MTRQLMMAAIAVFLLAACGKDSGETPEVAEDSPAAAATGQAPSVPVMTAADGWVALHDVDLPEPGTARVDIAGESILFAIECQGPGEFDESIERPAMTSMQLFSARFSGEGTLANGRRVTVSGYRRVLNEEEAEREQRFYRYPGQDRASLDFIVFDEDGLAHSSFQGGPNDRNRDGLGLPMLHVQPDGSFTAVTDMISAATMIPGEHEFHRDALAGPVTLAGRCPQRWDESPLPGGMSAIF
jgi:hypothetical protein